MEEVLPMLAIINCIPFMAAGNTRMTYIPKRNGLVSITSSIRVVLVVQLHIDRDNRPLLLLLCYCECYVNLCSIRREEE